MPGASKPCGSLLLRTKISSHPVHPRIALGGVCGVCPLRCACCVSRVLQDLSNLRTARSGRLSRGWLRGFRKRLRSSCWALRHSFSAWRLVDCMCLAKSCCFRRADSSRMALVRFNWRVQAASSRKTFQSSPRMRSQAQSPRRKSASLAASYARDVKGAEPPGRKLMYNRIPASSAEMSQVFRVARRT